MFYLNFSIIKNSHSELKTKPSNKKYTRFYFGSQSHFFENEDLPTLSIIQKHSGLFDIFCETKQECFLLATITTLSSNNIFCKDHLDNVEDFLTNCVKFSIADNSVQFNVLNTTFNKDGESIFDLNYLLHVMFD